MRTTSTHSFILVSIFLSLSIPRPSTGQTTIAQATATHATPGLTMTPQIVDDGSELDAGRLERYLRALELELQRQIEKDEAASDQGHPVAKTTDDAERLVRHCRLLKPWLEALETSMAAEWLADLLAVETQAKSLRAEPETNSSVQTTKPKIPGAVMRGAGTAEAMISGTVTDAESGMVISDVTVRVWYQSESRLQEILTDSLGNYSFTVPVGTYFLTAGGRGYVQEAWENLPCPDGAFSTVCNPEFNDATPIVLISGEARVIDFALDFGATIEGQVSDTATGKPLAGISVRILDSDDLAWDDTRTDASGNWSIGALASGTYHALTDDSLFLGELYDDIPCPFGDCDPDDGTPIDVTVGTTTSDIDFALGRMGSISGSVINASTGGSLGSIELDILGVGHGFFAIVTTTGSGTYSFEVPPGDYYVRTSTYFGFQNKFYDNVVCSSGDPALCGATLVTVTGDEDLTGIDFALFPLQTITGQIRDDLTGEPIPGQRTLVYNEAGEIVASGHSDLEGHYETHGVVPGSYFVTVDDGIGFQRNGYLTELYEGLPCGNDCDPLTGTPVLVQAGASTTDIDFDLTLGGFLSGRVIDAGTGEPVDELAAVRVEVWNEHGFVAAAGVGAEGRYRAIRLATGTYFVAAGDNGSRYNDEIHPNLPCPEIGPACDPRASGTPISVTAREETSGVDFALLPEVDACQAGDTTLCLNDNRFRVEVAWHTAAGASGSGEAEELTDDSGYFWFFGADNVELVIKILNGCFAPFDSFWVFAAGLTDVEVEITVIDTFSGVVKTYQNPRGMPFQPILDTFAFATCSAASQTPQSSTPQSINPQSSTPQSSTPQSSAPQPINLTDVKDTCVTGAEDLCLNDQRFLVEVFWATRNGGSGQGQAVPLTNNTGFFWFFGADNIELVVKVLDACELDDFNSFWVFAAGLTDVEVKLRVTDTVTGTIQEYFQPLGTPFQPVLDTSAFLTCPSRVKSPRQR